MRNKPNGVKEQKRKTNYSTERATLHPTKGWKAIWINHRNGITVGSEWKFNGFSLIRP